MKNKCLQPQSSAMQNWQLWIRWLNWLRADSQPARAVRCSFSQLKTSGPATSSATLQEQQITWHRTETQRSDKLLRKAMLWTDLNRSKVGNVESSPCCKPAASPAVRWRFVGWLLGGDNDLLTNLLGGDNDRQLLTNLSNSHETPSNSQNEHFEAWNEHSEWTSNPQVNLSALLSSPLISLILQASRDFCRESGGLERDDYSLRMSRLGHLAGDTLRATG